MYLLEIDHEHNRLHITLSESFDEPQAKALFDELRSRLGELKQDFDVLCNLTTLKHLDQSAKAYQRVTMDLCHECGVRKIVRIVPDLRYSFGLKDMSKLYYDSGVPVVTCRSLEEALKHVE